jgi:hypothetical protein
MRRNKKLLHWDLTFGFHCIKVPLRLLESESFAAHATSYRYVPIGLYTTGAETEFKYLSISTDRDNIIRNIRNYRFLHQNRRRPKLKCYDSSSNHDNPPTTKIIIMVVMMMMIVIIKTKMYINYSTRNTHTSYPWNEYVDNDKRIKIQLKLEKWGGGTILYSTEQNLLFLWAPYAQLADPQLRNASLDYLYFERLTYSETFGTQVRGFKPGRSRRIFRAKKSSARLPSEGK